MGERTRELGRGRWGAVHLALAAALVALGAAIAADACAGQDVRCGNGVVDPGEQCDDGNQDNNDGCTTFCRLSICGDGITDQATEECDDGSTVPGDGCDGTCHREGATCGNGTLEDFGSWPEECDDGNQTNGDGCSATCYNEIGSCGDGTRQFGEQCDDGNRTPCDGCSEDCRIEPHGCDADAATDVDVPIDGDADGLEIRDGDAEIVDAEIVDGDADRFDGELGETDAVEDGETIDGDAVGDADGDADARDGWTCTDPVCDVAPQCGCEAGSKCSLLGAVRGCVSSGFLSEGRSCTNDTECSAGLYCAPAVGSDALLCHRFCATDADCPGVGSRCLVPVTGGSPAHELARLCTVPCEVDSGSGCPESTRCRIFQDASGDYLTDCSGTVGSGRLGHACADDSDCAAGFFCAAPAYPSCLQYCVAPDGYCDGGFVCREFVPPVVVGTTRYGYCG